MQIFKLNMLLNNFIFCILLFLVGCNHNVIITPNQLPEATLGKSYFAKVVIDDYPVNTTSFDFSLTPSDIGVTVDVCDKEDKTLYTFNCFIIKGTPQKLTNITFHIQGSLLPLSGFFNTLRTFDKTYVIKVKEKE